MTHRNQHTLQESPVVLPDWTRPPAPRPGCDMCTALDKQRAEAEQAGDIRRATLLEVDMRSHSRHGQGGA